MAFPVSEEQKAIFRRRLAATAREVQPPTGSFAESARARQAAANDRANGIMPVRGPDQPAFSYQDHVGNNNRQIYGNSQANRGGNENAQGYVPHPSPRIPAAPVPRLPGAAPANANPRESAGVDALRPANVNNQLTPQDMAAAQRDNDVRSPPLTPQDMAAAAQRRPMTPQDMAAMGRSQAEGRGADSLREKIAGIMAAPAIQGPVMDSPRIQSMRAQKDANVRTYGSMGQSPEMQDRMESGYNKAMGIGQPQAGGQSQPQSIFPRQAPPNNRMQGSVPTEEPRDMSGVNGVQMGSFRPGGSQVPYIPGQGTDGSIQDARFVLGRRNAPLTEGNRGTFVGRTDSGALSLTGDKLTPAQREYYANKSAKIAQEQKDRALAYKDTRALRAVGRDPKLANRPAVIGALGRLPQRGPNGQLIGGAAQASPSVFRSQDGSQRMVPQMDQEGRVVGQRPFDVFSDATARQAPAVRPPDRAIFGEENFPLVHGVGSGLGAIGRSAGDVVGSSLYGTPSANRDSILPALAAGAAIAGGGYLARNAIRRPPVTAETLFPPRTTTPPVTPPVATSPVVPPVAPTPAPVATAPATSSPVAPATPAPVAAPAPATFQPNSIPREPLPQNPMDVNRPPNFNPRQPIAPVATPAEIPPMTVDASVAPANRNSYEAARLRGQLRPSSPSMPAVMPSLEPYQPQPPIERFNVVGLDDADGIPPRGAGVPAAQPSVTIAAGKKWLSGAEAAQMYGIDANAIERARKSGQLQGVADRGVWKFRAGEMDSFVTGPVPPASAVAGTPAAQEMSPTMARQVALHQEALAKPPVPDPFASGNGAGTQAAQGMTPETPALDSPSSSPRRPGTTVKVNQYGQEMHFTTPTVTVGRQLADDVDAMMMREGVAAGEGGSASSRSVVSKGMKSTIDSLLAKGYSPNEIADDLTKSLNMAHGPDSATRPEALRQLEAEKAYLQTKKTGIPSPSVSTENVPPAKAVGSTKAAKAAQKAADALAKMTPNQRADMEAAKLAESQFKAAGGKLPTTVPKTPPVSPRVEGMSQQAIGDNTGLQVKKPGSAISDLVEQYNRPSTTDAEKQQILKQYHVSKGRLSGNGTVRENDYAMRVLRKQVPLSVKKIDVLTVQAQNRELYNTEAARQAAVDALKPKTPKARAMAYKGMFGAPGAFAKTASKAIFPLNFYGDAANMIRHGTPEGDIYKRNSAGAYQPSADPGVGWLQRFNWMGGGGSGSMRDFGT